MTVCPDTWTNTKSDKSSHGNMNFTPEPLMEDQGTGIWVVLTHNGQAAWPGFCFRYNNVLPSSSSRAQNHIRKYSQNLNDLVLSVEIPEEGLLHTATVDEKLNFTRDTFGFSVASLAKIIGASRASVYNWLENEPPTERFVQRIENLYEIAQEWKTKNSFHYAPGKLMKQKLGDGPSMFDRLCSEELDINNISNGMDSLLMLMNKQRERMDRSKSRSAKASTDAENHKEMLERLIGSVTADS